MYSSLKFPFVSDFSKNYYNEDCKAAPRNTSIAVSVVGINYTDVSNNVSTSTGNFVDDCLKENSVLFLLLMLGTVWLGITLFNFTKT